MNLVVAVRGLEASFWSLGLKVVVCLFSRAEGNKGRRGVGGDVVEKVGPSRGLGTSAYIEKRQWAMNFSGQAT